MVAMNKYLIMRGIFQELTMNAETLMKKYQQLIATPVESPSSFNESGESLATLIQTSTLRILLVRSAENPKNVAVEVEVWLPSRNSEPLSDDTSDEDLSAILSRMISHLQYLLRLHKSGFTLDVIKHDCLWTASRSFTKTPSRELFELLIPP